MPVLVDRSPAISRTTLKRSSKRRGRLPVLLAIVVVIAGGLGVAWFDGGEEPLRPIVQSVERGDASGRT